MEAARRNSQPIIPQVVTRLEPSDATAHELSSTARLAEDGRQLALAADGGR